MIIECPFCHARAKISDMQEGAKVRCGECSKIYVSRQVGRKSSSSSNNTSYLVAGIVGLVSIVGLGIVMSDSSGDSDDSSGLVPLHTYDEDPQEAAERRAALSLGWDNHAVQAMVSMHQAAQDANQGRILGKLALERAWARLTAGDEDGPELPEDWPAGDSYAALSAPERQRVSGFLVADILEGPLSEYMREWAPFNGSVLSEENDEIVIELIVRKAGDTSGSTRTLHWSVVRQGDNLLAWDWTRILTLEEKMALRGPGRGGNFTVRSDGSRVRERDPEPLEHLADTSPEDRERIERLFATMIDLNLTREATAAQRELVALGRPAIPVLLTGLFELPLNTMDDAIQVNLVDQTLQQITGKDFGYAPMIAVGSAGGTSEEMRTSAIRQWFAWWYRNADRFEEGEFEDALDDHLELTDEERRYNELHPDD